eukprot:403338533
MYNEYQETDIVKQTYFNSYTDGQQRYMNYERSDPKDIFYQTPTDLELQQQEYDGIFAKDSYGNLYEENEEESMIQTKDISPLITDQQATTEIVYCLVCYNSSTVFEMFKIQNCEHKFCRMCINNHLIANVRIRKVIDINCLQYTCQAKFTNQEIESYLSGDMKHKYQQYFNDYMVLMKGNVKYCPNPTCNFLNEIGLLIGQKITCSGCSQDFCKKCNFSWHEDKTCEQVKEQEFGQWVDDKQANKCPKCKSRVEKNSGCQHMTCPVCKYEWCWVCGLSYKSFFHYAQFGSLFCELIGGSLFRKNKYLATLFFFLTLIGLPFITILIFTILAFAGPIVLLQKISDKYPKVKEKFQPFKHYQFNKRFKRYLKNLYNLIYYIILIGLLVANGAIAITLGVTAAAITIAPLYIIFFLILICLVLNWRRRNTL